MTVGIASGGGILLGYGIMLWMVADRFGNIWELRTNAVIAMAIGIAIMATCAVYTILPDYRKAKARYTCPKCGSSLAKADFALCPYCGEKLTPSPSN